MKGDRFIPGKFGANFKVGPETERGGAYEVRQESGIFSEISLTKSETRMKEKPESGKFQKK